MVEPTSDGMELGQSDGVLSRAEEIRAKLDTGSLSANQRKKYRKKLSKLFHSGAAAEDSSDLSVMHGEAASGCTFISQHSKRRQHPEQSAEPECSVGMPASREDAMAAAGAIPAAALPAADAGHGGSDCVTVLASHDGQERQGTGARQCKGQYENSWQATLHHEPQASSGAAAVQARPAHPNARAAFVPGLPRRPGPPGSRNAADLSGVMHMIAKELKVLDSSPTQPAGSAPAGSRQQRGMSPCPSAGRSFCRVNMSQELSVISAELSGSVLGGARRLHGTEATGQGREVTAGGMEAGHSHVHAQQPGSSQQQEAGQHVMGRKRHREDAVAGVDGQVQAGEEGQEEVQTAGPGPDKQGGGKKRKMFVHGNYQNYYGYRSLGSFEQDPRLRLLQPGWFQGRDMLDIGCNEGLVTLAVAAGFGCGRSTGVDIDASLVKRALSNLREMRVRLSKQLSGKRSGEPGYDDAVPGHAAKVAAAVINGMLASSRSGGKGAGAGCDDAQLNDEGAAALAAEGATEPEEDAAGPGPSSSGAGASSSSSATWPQQQAALRHALKALNRTRFKHQDWSKGRTRQQNYDTIMCLSVTKWVHLNGGDVALKRLFKRMYDSLMPGGFLVLEPQPWRSYRSAVTKRQTCAVPFRQIDQLQFRPEHFLQHLTQVLGFTQVADLNADSTAQHFDRPLYVLQRPGNVPRLLLAFDEEEVEVEVKIA